MRFIFFLACLLPAASVFGQTHADIPGDCTNMIYDAVNDRMHVDGLSSDTDRTDALLIQQADATNVFQADTLNGRIGVHTANPLYPFQVESTGRYDPAIYLKAHPDADTYDQPVLFVHQPEDKHMSAGITMKAGSTGNYRRYLRWLDFDDAERGIIGFNPLGHFVAYNAQNSNHFFQANDFGSTMICADAGDVKINWQSGMACGTGGLTVYNGAVSPTRYGQITIAGMTLYENDASDVPTFVLQSGSSSGVLQVMSNGSPRATIQGGDGRIISGSVAATSLVPTQAAGEFKGHSTQSANILEARNDADAELFSVSPTGAVAMSNTATVSNQLYVGSPNLNAQVTPSGIDLFENDGSGNTTVQLQSGSSSGNILVKNNNATRITLTGGTGNIAAEGDVIADRSLQTGGDLTASGKTAMGNGATRQISNGAINYTSSYHLIQPEGDTFGDDDLTDITGGTAAGEILILRCWTTLTGATTGITVRHNAPGNLRLKSDAVLKDSWDTITFLYSGAVWCEIARNVE